MKISAFTNMIPLTFANHSFPVSSCYGFLNIYNSGQISYAENL